MTTTTDDSLHSPHVHTGTPAWNIHTAGGDYRHPLNLDLTPSPELLALARPSWNDSPALLPAPVNGTDIPVEILRFIWQSAARELLPKDRVSKCLRELAPFKSKVSIEHSQSRQRARFGNLYVCGRLWQCPVCAARISEQRRWTLSDQLAALPHFPMMITYTLQHDRQDKLKDLLGLLSDARRKKFKAGRAWMAIQQMWGFEASVRALEVTYGGSGWHVHIHELALLRANPGDALPALAQELKKRWQDSVGASGGYASMEHGLDLSVDAKDIGDYVAKIGKDDFLTISTWSLAHEVAKSVTKLGREGGRTMNQLLHDYRFAGDIRAGHIWKEYAETFKGKKQLEPASFAHLIPDGEPEKSDEELAAASDPDRNILGWLSWADWKIILKHERRGDVLEAARQGSIAELSGYLAGMGITLELPQ
jgi:hypothetical protein